MDEHNLKQAWGDWLSTLGKWQWFVTITLRDPAPNDVGWTKPGWAYAKKAWKDFISRAQPGLGQLQWVRVFELQHWRGVPHIHALVGNVDQSVRRMEMVDWAYERYGITRVLEYNQDLGARFYLCKYLTKEIADIDFGGIEVTGKEIA
jgi:hypothetical protein